MALSFSNELTIILQEFEKLKTTSKINILDKLQDKIYEHKKKLTLHLLKLDKYKSYIYNYIESNLFYNPPFIPRFLSQMISVFIDHTSLGNKIINFSNEFQIKMTEPNLLQIGKFINTLEEDVVIAIGHYFRFLDIGGVNTFKEIRRFPDNNYGICPYNTRHTSSISNYFYYQIICGPKRITLTTLEHFYQNFYQDDNFYGFNIKTKFYGSI
jgi:hypothetical protein